MYRGDGEISEETSDEAERPLTGVGWPTKPQGYPCHSLLALYSNNGYLSFQHQPCSYLAQDLLG